MSTRVLLHKIPALLAIAAMMIPAPLAQAQQLGGGNTQAVVHTGAIRDVTLFAGGSLRGQVVNAAGLALVGAVVRVHQDRELVATVLTGTQGRFVVTGLRGGVYYVESEQGGQLCRAWASGSAPPSAMAELLIVTGETLGRGQRPISALLFSDAVLLTLVGVGAVVVPVAIHNSQSGS